MNELFSLAVKLHVLLSGFNLDSAHLSFPALFVSVFLLFFNIYLFACGVPSSAKETAKISLPGAAELSNIRLFKGKLLKSDICFSLLLAEDNEFLYSCS